MPIRKKMFWAIYSLILLLTLIINSLVFITYKHDMESRIAQFGNQAVKESAVNISRDILGKEENLTYKIGECNLFTEEDQGIPYAENSRKMKILAALVNNSGFQVISCYLRRADGTEEFWTDGSVSIADFRASDISSVLRDEDEILFYNRGTTIWRRMDDRPESVYIIKNVIDEVTLRKQAVLCIQIDRSFFQSLQNTGNLPILLYDENGGLLYCSEELEPFMDEILSGRDGGFITMHADISRKGWSMTGLIGKQQALDTLYRLLGILSIIELIFCIISFGVAKYVSGTMTANISALMKGMRQLEQGKPADKVQAESTDETAYLVEAFNHLNQKLQETIELLAINRTQRERAEYNALIAQLNPHFLYNALESVSSMAKLNHQNGIVEAVDSLAKLLRVCLSGNDSEITLDKEFDYIRQYLSLEKLMTGGGMDWDIDCDEELYTCRVPKLILQPLVENCILHGFDGGMQEAMIAVIARTEGERLVVEVSDNGTGMSQSYADRILAGAEAEKSGRERRHIGLKSIRERIAYLYGEQYGVQIQTKEQAGTTVRLTLPLIKE